MKINHGSALIYSCINVSTIHDKDMHQVRFFDKDIILGVQAYYKDESITFRGVQMKLHLFRQFFCVLPCIHFNQAETIYSPQSINDELLVLGKTCAFYSKHGLTLKEKKFNISNFANCLVFKVGMFCCSCNLR